MSKKFRVPRVDSSERIAAAAGRGSRVEGFLLGHRRRRRSEGSAFVRLSPARYRVVRKERFSSTLGVHGCLDE